MSTAAWHALAVLFWGAVVLVGGLALIDATIQVDDLQSVTEAEQEVQP